MKHQSRFRKAVLPILLLLPFQPLISEASFRPMTDQEMAGVSGRGDARILDSADRADTDDVLKLVTGGLVPVLNLLESDTSIAGVHYHPDTSRLSVTNDGDLKLALPERIEQIRMDNIRVGTGPSMGNVIISDVRFDAGSSLTIYAR